MLNPIDRSSIPPSQLFSGVSMPSKGVMITMVALAALASLPTVSAGAGAYWSCIQTCCGGGPPPTWYHAVVCPTICAPFLLAPG